MDPALDRSTQLREIGGSPAGQHKVEGLGSVGVPARHAGVPGRLCIHERGAAPVVRHGLRHAVLDQRQRALGRALGIEATGQALWVGRRVGQVDGGRGHLPAQPA